MADKEEEADGRGYPLSLAGGETSDHSNKKQQIPTAGVQTLASSCNAVGYQLLIRLPDPPGAEGHPIHTNKL